MSYARLTRKRKRCQDFKTWGFEGRTRQEIDKGFYSECIMHILARGSISPVSSLEPAILMGIVP
jgi:hypothetical protein